MMAFHGFVGLTKWKLMLLLPFCTMENRSEIAWPAVLHLSSILCLLVKSSTCFLVELSILCQNSILQKFLQYRTLQQYGRVA